MTNIALSCTNIHKQFGSTIAVNALDLSVRNGEILVLLGPSGCGKTTTLRLIAGLDRPDNGIIYIGDNEASSPHTFLSPEKRNIGMVFQDYALFPHMNVEDNVAYGLDKNPNRQDRMKETLQMTNLTGLEKRFPYQLSGGEQQRVALARALATDPKVLLLDEPFSNLDAQLRSTIRKETKEIIKNTDIATILVTHSQEEALIMGDKIGVMNLGKIEQLDVPYRIFHNPTSQFVAQFIGTCDFLPARINEGIIYTEIGNIYVRSEVSDNDNIVAIFHPDDLQIKGSDKGIGVIHNRIFHGSFYMYDVTLHSGNIVHISTHHTQNFDIGLKVNVSISPNRPISYLIDGEISHN
jgi:iron(III) transport system ATP-binding protein